MILHIVRLRMYIMLNLDQNVLFMNNQDVEQHLFEGHHYQMNMFILMNHLQVLVIVILIVLKSFILTMIDLYNMKKKLFMLMIIIMILNTSMMMNLLIINEIITNLVIQHQQTLFMNKVK